MSNRNFISRRFLSFTLVVFLMLLVTGYFGLEPVTRKYVATDANCGFCHVQREYLYSAWMSFTRRHPPETEADQSPARCADCHLPEGFLNTAYLYTHFVSITDLFGRFRDREGERAGDWIPLSAARAYRVRERLLEHNSTTCRSCHIESEIIPESVRGQTAHKDAMANKETCIECHSNLVHRFVEDRVTASDSDAEAEDVEGAEEFDEFNEFKEAPASGETEQEPEVL